MSDEELVQQIKSVFEDYNDGLGERGWIDLRKKYPEKENKKLPIWWLTGLAASLLLAAGLYFNDTFDTKKIILRANTSSKEHFVTESNNINTNNNSISSSQTDHLANRNGNPIQKTAIQPNKLEKSINSTEQFIAKNADTKGNNPTQEATQGISNPNTSTNPPLTVIENSSSVIAMAKPEEKTIINERTTSGTEPTEQNTKPTKLSTEDFLKQQSKILANNTDKETKKNSAATTTLDVFTGTFFNYHDDNEAKLSAGLGLNANVKVTNNLIFSFGAGISQNKVSYENKVPVEVSQAMFSSKEGTMNMAPSNGAYSATASNDVSFNGRLLSIDLPMVVKFFPSKKQDFYISTGINSSSYITQKYTYNYSWSNFGVKNGEAQVQQETEESGLKGFDFANSAIIAIGINQNIGKNILIFEPYYKPALSTMGDKNLRISSAGLNLKFNFNGNQKK